MKRTGIILTAGLLALGLGVSASSAAKGKKVKSEVEVDAWYYDSDDNDQVAVGDVHSNKPKCEKARKVTVISYEGPFLPPPAEGEGDPIGKVTTDKSGDWEFTIDDSFSPSYLTATVTRRKLTTRSGKKLTCKADKAPPLLAD